MDLKKATFIVAFFVFFDKIAYLCYNIDLMSDTFTKVLPNGHTLSYTPMGGNRPRFMFTQKDAQGRLLQMGEVYNPVLTEQNINDFDTLEMDKKDGRWMTFYPYPKGQNPFKYIASQSNYRMDVEMGNFRRFYSREDKPYDDNLSKESGKLVGLYHVHASQPLDEIVFVDMMGCKHRCQYERGKPYTGEVVHGYGKGNVWRESILTYQEGKIQPKTIRIIYTRPKAGEPYMFYARQVEKAPVLPQQNGR